MLQPINDRHRLEDCRPDISDLVEEIRAELECSSGQEILARVAHVGDLFWKLDDLLNEIAETLAERRKNQ